MRTKKKVGIEWRTKKCTAQQVYQSGLQYAFVSPDYEQSTVFVYCKDFLQDAVQGFICKRKVCGIYRFTYDHEEDPAISLDKVRLLLANQGDPNFRDKISGCLDFMRQIENKLKIRYSDAWECLDPPKKYASGGVWLFEGSRRWIKSPPMLSLYTLLLRIGFIHEEGKSYKSTIKQVSTGAAGAYQEQDRSQLKYAQKGINRILKQGDRKIFFRDIRENYPPVAIDTMHDTCGIVGFAQGDTKGVVPHWHRKIKEIKKKTKPIRKIEAPPSPPRINLDTSLDAPIVRIEKVY